jgi:hypothetical protein
MRDDDWDRILRTKWNSVAATGVPSAAISNHPN